MQKTTLCYIEKDNKYLMLYRNKKINDLNHGKWIGVGGKLEKDETPNNALIREVKEETGLILDDFKLRGLIHFKNNDFEELMYLYTSDKFHGELIDCVEGELHYIPKNEIFNLNLWEGDKVFLEYLQNDEPYFELKLIYEDDKLITVDRIK